MKQKIFFLNLIRRSKHLFFAGFVFSLLASAAVLGAQTVHDPNSEIYKDIDRWAVLGYVKEFLPLIRPYPAPLIDKILAEAIDNGDAETREKAAGYRETLAPGTRFLHPGALAYAQGKNSDYGLIAAPFVEGLGRIANMLSVSYNLSFFGVTDTDGEGFNIPGTYSPYPDFVSDVANIGPVDIIQNWTSLFAIGKSDVYFQAGLARASVGPFYDNGLVVGPQAPRAGHFSFVFYRPQWSFEMLFQTLTATDDFGGGNFPGKFLIMHTIAYRPLEKLELGFIQTLVYGGRFEPLYLVPFTYLFASQTIYDFDDNAFMGLHVRWRPFDTFMAKTQFYIDDLSFNGLFSGEPKFKLAAEAGISWTPKRTILAKLDFDYTAVFPYTYTHWALPDDAIYKSGSPNNLNYTHLGRSIGPDLDPNSDRISLRAEWNLHPRVDLNLSAYMIRHANPSKDKDGLTDYNDGSIFDHGTAGDPNNQDSLNEGKNKYIYGWYLTQGLIGVRLGGTIEAVWTIPVSFGTFKLSGGYCAQYGWNRWEPGREPQKNDNGLDHLWSAGVMWSW